MKNAIAAMGDRYDHYTLDEEVRKPTPDGSGQDPFAAQVVE